MSVLGPSPHAQAIPDNGGFTALFVRRPILAFVVNALILVAGLAAALGVEVRELPDVDRPVITVTTRFPGAAPETVDQELTGRIEGAVGRVSGVQSISSSSRYGRSRVTMEFSGSVDIDVAATDTRDAIARIVNDLPDDAETPVIVKADANADPVMRLALTSPGRRTDELTRVLRDSVEDALISIPGVADLQIYGEADGVFRIDIDMLELASRGLSLADIRHALETVAFDVPAGDLKGDRQSINVRTTATVNTPDAFEAILIGPDVRLRDVARVTLGPAPNQTALRANGRAGIGIGIIRQATSNTLDIARQVRAAVDDLNRSLPPDIDLFVTSDDAVFINGAIREVLFTLVLSVVIVVAIIYLFLRDLRATLIPAVTLPVALVGTIAAVYVVGFSVNILTLLALVLATGMVVDDAIVVLENIVRRRAEGMGPRAAAVLGTRQVLFAVITTTATLAAVFVPLSFLPGQAGGLFREFGFTLAMSVLISSVVALTLAPVLASRLLERSGVATATGGPVAWLGKGLAQLYGWSLRGALANPLVVVVAAVLFAAAAALVAGGIRQELTPREDRALVLARITAPTGVALEYTIDKLHRLEERVRPLQDGGEVRNVFSVVGFGADNIGFMVMTLAPWDERTRTQQQIVGEMDRLVADVVGVRVFVIQPNSLRIRGAGRGLSFAITGEDYAQLARVGDRLVELMQRDPRLGQVRLEYETTLPQLFVEVDRVRASDLGVDISGLGDALRAVLDGRAIGSVFIGDTSFEVQMISTSDPVDDPGDLQRIFIRSADGQMVPMSSFVRLEERPVAPELDREGKKRAVRVTATLTPAMSLGAAMDEVERLGAAVLAEANALVPLAEAAALEQTSSGLVYTFGFAILVVLLVLAGQFESFVSALVVMATVPLGLACAIFALSFTGLSLNVYSQIGLVMLVGIMAKNGILIVEFANQLRDRGADIGTAIHAASTIRLRPVMMTMTSTVLGGVPLILSSGAGAEAREALGWVIVGGLGLATLATLYLTPVAYLLLAGFSTPQSHEHERLRRELGEAAARPVPTDAA